MAMKSALVLLMLSLSTATVFADDMAKSDCKQPPVPNMQASDVIVKFFEKKAKNYSDCIAKFVATQRAVEKSATNQTQLDLAHNAAESAIVEFNKFSEELKERNSHTPGAEDANE